MNPLLFHARRASGAALLLAGLACFSPSAPVVYHTLAAVPPRDAGPGSTLAVEVLAVTIPDVLQRPQIVATLAPGGLELTPGHRWGNSLEKDMQRVLVADLSALLRSDRVVAAPNGSRVKASYRVQVDVQRCEGRPGGTLTFQATWMITRPQETRALFLRTTSLEVPVGGKDAYALVAAHDQALAGLGKEIAACLTEGDRSGFSPAP